MYFSAMQKDTFRGYYPYYQNRQYLLLIETQNFIK